MYLQLTDVEPLTPDQVTAELDAAEAKGPALPNVGGIPCYDISDACALGIATMYGVRDKPGRSYLWMFANRVLVGPEYIHDDIDETIEALDDADSESDAETRAARSRALLFLKGWLYLRTYNRTHDIPTRHPAQFQLKLRSISVRDLIGRSIANRKGREFKIVDVRYDLEFGKVMFELAYVDEDGIVDRDDVSGISELEGWTVL